MRLVRVLTVIGHKNSGNQHNFAGVENDKNNHKSKTYCNNTIMDVGAANTTDTNIVVDPVGSRCQKLFQDFLEEWQEGEELKYLKAARDLVKPERNTLVVSMKDVERYNPGLAQSIQDEYYRLYPYLCDALKNYVNDRAEATTGKEYFVAFSDVDAQLKVRDLNR